ncbi:hypothetical protein K502DRAFT_322593 [Neoconidiobolus thromboides FSU 785]|nr:hypothetical protein K502DRAFT_322593 [Neoconidiobolus thromboides FSU 785]
MGWINNSAIIYNTYQDLILLEKKHNQEQLTSSDLQPNTPINTKSNVPEINIIDESGVSVPISHSHSNSIGTFNVKSTVSSPLQQNFHLTQDNKPYNKLNHSIPKDKGILSLHLAPNKEYFICITHSSVELWVNKPTILVAQIIRTEDSLVTQGGNVDISWKKESNAFCVFTTKGYIYFYDITNKLINKSNNRQNYYPLNQDISNQLNSFDINNNNNCWLRNPNKYFDLKINIIIFVEAGIRCLMCLNDEILVSTERNPSLNSYGWKEKVLLSSLHLAYDAKFLTNSNVMINEINYDNYQNLFLFLTSDGSVYLTKRKVELSIFAAGSPYEWNGVPCHLCDGTIDSYAIHLAININYYLVAVAMKNNQIYIYNYTKNGNSVKLSYKIQVNSKINCINWSENGQILAVGTSNKGLIIYHLFNDIPSFVANSGKHGFGLNSITDDDPFSDVVHWMRWNSNDNELLIISNKNEETKGKIYSLNFELLNSMNYHTDNNIKFPILFDNNQIKMQFFEQTELGSINPNALAHVSQIPLIYAMDNFPIKFVSANKDGTHIAIAGQHGLAHYSLISKKWKWFNQHNQEQSIICLGGIIWFKQSIIIGCKIDDHKKYMIKSFPREKNLDITNVSYSIELNEEPIYLNLVNQFLLVYTKDNILNFFEVFSDSNGRVNNMIPVHKISLEGVVKSPEIVKGVSWFPGNIREAFPKMLILVAGTLLMFTPEQDNSNQTRYKITMICEKVNYFQLLDLPLAGVHFTLWAYSEGEIKLWYYLPEVPYYYDNIMEDEDFEETKTLKPEIVNEFRYCLSYKVPFYVVQLDIKQGLIFGIEQNMNQSNNIPGLQFIVNYKSQILFYKLIDELIMNNLDQEAYLYCLSYETLPYFSFGLEIFLHDVLVREAEQSTNNKTKIQLDDENETLASDTAMLPKVVNLIKQFVHYPQIIVSCARKIEIALWDHLFQIVGSPILLFNHCINTNQLKVAASYLIILHTMEKEEVSFNATSKLIHLLIRYQEMNLFHQVLKFVLKIHGTKDIKFLNKYLAFDLDVLIENKDDKDNMFHESPTDLSPQLEAIKVEEDANDLEVIKTEDGAVELSENQKLELIEKKELDLFYGEEEKEKENQENK